MVDSIVALGVDSIKLPHPRGEVAPGGFDEEVVVVIHQAVSMTEQVMPLRYRGEDIQKCLSIMIIVKYRLPSVPSGGHMVEGSWKLNSKRPCHI